MDKEKKAVEYLNMPNIKNKSTEDDLSVRSGADVLNIICFEVVGSPQWKPKYASHIRKHHPSLNENKIK